MDFVLRMMGIPRYDEVEELNGDETLVTPGCGVPTYDIDDALWSHSPSCINFKYLLRLTLVHNSKCKN